MDIIRLRRAVAAGRVQWRMHALKRLMERNIKRETVLDAVTNGEQIEDYPQDKPYPSALFFGWHNDTPIHVVVALDEQNLYAYIITVYEPNLDEFKEDYKTRRKV
ncbi:DUF4258 domain-containing protein [Candidatus Peregrinibacteria bacterium]|nr:DUF4258 domain-containing protein [Candidatus Peregrinibacteria bacterium]